MEGKASAEEVQFLEAYYKAFDLKGEYTDKLSEQEFLDLKGRIKRKTDDAIHEYEAARKSLPGIGKLFRYGIAASLLFGLLIFAYYQLSPRPTESKQLAEHIMPGRDMAILTLSNGKQILLDSVDVNTSLEEEGILISKTADGYLSYQLLDNDATNNPSGAIAYNTISTPEGGQYSVSLPDGTKVWLNASSSIRYPVRFDSKYRSIEMDGEGYFEVAKQLGASSSKPVPFIVQTAMQQVEVLGTHFNINAYGDEDRVKTTLLEGSVRVTPSGHSGESKILKPNQQSILRKSDANGSLEIVEVESSSVIDWKNGNFIFDNENLVSIMNKISRWYKVKVVYEGHLTPDDFGGQISRSKNLQEVLDVLELSGGVQFKMTKDTIVVMPEKKTN